MVGLLTHGRLQPDHPLYKIAGGGDFVAAKNTHGQVTQLR
jgi:hypothetical protein